MNNIRSILLVYSAFGADNVSLILNAIERIKLLNMLFDNYFDSRPPKEQIIKEKEEILWSKEDE